MQQINNAKLSHYLRLTVFSMLDTPSVWRLRGLHKATYDGPSKISNSGIIKSKREVELRVPFWKQNKQLAHRKSIYDQLFDMAQIVKLRCIVY